MQLKLSWQNFNNMNPKLFLPEQRKQLVSLAENGWAYIPAQLPPKLELEKLLIPLTRASADVGELNGAARRLQNPYMLILPLLRREALTSSAMEGTITTLGDMILEEAGGKPSSQENAREATNYIRAIETGIRRLDEIPISHRLIKELHKILLNGLSKERGVNKRPGEYKVNQNAVGKHGDTILTARYVPPPPAETQICMDDLEKFINEPEAEPAYRLTRLALVHYQFEAIHPFDDGNGRIGRMLITLMAQQSGLIDLPLLHMSAFLERRKDEYIEKLFQVSAAGAWTDWTMFFLDAVSHCAKEAIVIVDKIITLQSEFQQKVHEIGKSARLMKIADSLFDQWWITIPTVQAQCNVSYPTAKSDLQALCEAKILVELPSTHPRIYFSPQILALSDRPQN